MNVIQYYPLDEMIKDAVVIIAAIVILCVLWIKVED